MASISTDISETEPLSKLSPGPGLGAEEVASHQRARVHEALVQVVGESGYDSAKVRDIVRVAGISSRAFYELFADKEDCFLQNYDLIARRATRGLMTAQDTASSPRERLLHSLDEMVDGIEREPGSARLALAEVHAAGEAASEHARGAERVLVGMLAEAFARPPGGMVLPPLVLEGVTVGIGAMVRRRLLDGKVAQLKILKGGLLVWASSFIDGAAGSLARLDRKGVRDNKTFVPMTIESLDGEEPSREAAEGSRVLTAVSELTVADGYSGLTISGIRSAAGLTRRRFDAVFDNVEDCYLAAVELRIEEAFVEAEYARARAASWGGGVHQVIATLCDRIGADPFLAKICRMNDGPSGKSAIRSRQRLTAMILDLIEDGAPTPGATLLMREASANALWGLFYRHNVCDWALRRRIAATLSYMVLAPEIGAPAVLSAIRAEQRG